MKVHIIDLSQEQSLTAYTVQKAMDNFLTTIKPQKIISIFTLETAGLIIIIYE